MKNLVAGVALVLLTTTSVHADAPPPDGKKYVGFAFKVEGLARFPDHVVVAFPWSTSGGAPTYEHTLVGDAAVTVGRRSPDVVLWAVKRATWEAFAKAELTSGDEDTQAAALTKFLVAPNAVRCSAAPAPVHMLSDDDPRSLVEETIVAKEISDTSCQLERVAPVVPEKKSGCAGGETGVGALFALVVALSARGRASRRHDR